MNIPAFCEIARKSGGVVRALRKKTASSAPVPMGCHPGRLIDDGTGIVDAYTAASQQDVAIFRLKRPDIIKQLEEMKTVSVEGAGQEFFKNQPGMYMWNFLMKQKVPTFPYKLAIQWTSFPRQPNRATKVAELPAKNSFQNMKEYEIVMCSALLSSLGVDITMNKGSGFVIPVNFREDRIIGEIKGEVSDRPTQADFLIYARLPMSIDKKMVANFRLQAQVSTVSCDRMFGATRKVGGMPPNDKLKQKHKFQRFDLVKTLLAHGPEADFIFGSKIQFKNFMKDEELQLFDSKMSQIKQLLMLDVYQAKAFDNVFGVVAAGLVITQGNPGTGKTRVNAGIAIFVVFLGLKVLVAAGSNGAVDALMLKIVELFEDNGSNQDGSAVDWTTIRDSGFPRSSRVEQQMAKGDSLDDKTLNRYTMSAYSKDAIREGLQRGDSFWKELHGNICDMRKGVRSYDHGNKLLSIFTENQDKAERLILSGAVSIVGSTLNTSSQDTTNCVKFDIILLDENCQSGEADTLIALKPALVVLTGDHKLLPPTVVSLGHGQNPYTPQLAKSLFARLVGQGYPFHMLKTQYRMHPHISA
ncbi:hypothetical protein MMC17_005265 [Xylographa soralifera]|nr:hypothetical protein [Xylographa soralifera]